MTPLEALANAACILATYVLIPGLWRWTRAHGRGLASWLIGPFRAWAGLDETRRPKP